MRIAEARPARGVVHHVVVYIVQGRATRADGPRWSHVDPGRLGPRRPRAGLPAGHGPAPAQGSQLRFEMHYTPNGTAAKDRSSVGITFAEKPPSYEMLIGEFANMAIEVPPHDPHYTAEATLPLPGRRPHSQLRAAHALARQGLSLRGDLSRRQTADAAVGAALGLQLAERLSLRGAAEAAQGGEDACRRPLGQLASTTCSIRIRRKTVRFGLQSWEEMMVGFVAYVWERPETAAELAKNPPSQADMFFDRLDANGDDFITPNEIPSRLKPFFEAAGVKADKKMSRAEFTKLFELVAPLMQPKRPNPGPSKDQPKKDEPKKSSRILRPIRCPGSSLA